MKNTSEKRNWLLILTIVAVICLATWAGIHRTHIDSDIFSVLPSGDLVLDDASKLLTQSAVLDRVVIDLSLKNNQADPDLLVWSAKRIEAWIDEVPFLEKSGSSAGMQAAPLLLTHITGNLPFLFSEADLTERVAKRLSPEAIEKAVEENLLALMEMEGIGQADLMGTDPLKLREIALNQMAEWNPLKDSSFYKGYIFTSEKKRLLLLASPVATGTDSDSARKILAFLQSIPERLTKENAACKELVITHAGTYRSTLDNESVIRKDATRAILIATIGVAFILLLCFPRPYLGILAFFPAVAGAGLALFVYSFFTRSISAMALGFGGALISITVDASIAFFLFLDRNEPTTGREVAKKIRSVSFFATVTTMLAFLSLLLTGFPLLKQIGLFAALGMGFSFLIVHEFLPLVFPRLEAAKRAPLFPVENLLGKINLGSRRWPTMLALGLVLILVFFAKPEFQVDLRKMNAIRPGTLAAEQTIEKHWGGIAGDVYVLSSEPTLQELQNRLDILHTFLDKEEISGSIQPAFSPAAIFPGEKLANQRRNHWSNFWSPERIASVKNNLLRSGKAHGFSDNAFDPFLTSLETPAQTPLPASETLLSFFGIEKRKNDKGFSLVTPIHPEAGYKSDSFHLDASANGLSVFDGQYFQDHLAGILAATFLKMFLLTGASVLVILSLLFLDWRLVILTITPLAFAVTCTLGVMHLLGRPMDIAGLMLAAVVLGMGVDYGIYFVRARQRFLKQGLPALNTIRTAVFLTAGSTLVGMLSMAQATHPVIRSAGITTFLGIGFALLFSFFILPPFLRRLYKPRRRGPAADPGSVKQRKLTIARYRHLAASIRMHARFKLLLDPMFPKLAKIVPEEGTVIDVGCGYGVPAAWLLASSPKLQFTCIEPDPERARIAAFALGSSTVVMQGTAPAFTNLPQAADAVLLLDIIHYLSDEELKTTLVKLKTHLLPHGKLIIRATVPGEVVTLPRRIEQWRLKFQKIPCRFRSEEHLTNLLKELGFHIQFVEPTTPGREETWFVAFNENPGDNV